jgi:hypothetical protein
MHVARDTSVRTDDDDRKVEVDTHRLWSAAEAAFFRYSRRREQDVVFSRYHGQLVQIEAFWVALLR